MTSPSNALSHNKLKSLQSSESRYRRLFEAAQDGILLINAETAQIEDVNPYLIELLGYSHAEFLGKKLWDVGSFSDRLESKAMFAELQSKGYVRYESLPLKTKAGAEVEVEFVSNCYDCDSINVIQCNIRNISDRKRIEDRMRQLALYDALTELPNRRLLQDRLSQTIAASKRWGCYGALMYIDLDNFKTLNDIHGHGVGDLLLIEAARRLKNCVRELDTVARIGGDEFVVILSDLNSDKANSTSLAKVAARKIRSRLSNPYLLTIKRAGRADVTVEHHCTASIGVALFINHEDSQEDILRHADTAMYQAKAAGSNLIRFYDAQAASLKAEHQVEH